MLTFMARNDDGPYYRYYDYDYDYDCYHDDCYSDSDSYCWYRCY